MSRTRGRIANVLASARASLNDPQRPVTPAHVSRDKPHIQSSAQSGLSSNDLLSIKLHPLQRPSLTNTLSDEADALISEINHSIARIQQLIHEKDAKALQSSLQSLFQYHNQIQNFYTLDNLNAFITVLFAIIKNKAFETSHVLCHFHLLKIFLYSEESHTPAIMNFIYNSMHFLHASWSSTKEELLTREKQEVFQTGIECIHEVLQLFEGLKTELLMALQRELSGGVSAESKAEEEQDTLQCYMRSLHVCVAILRLFAPTEEGRRRLCLTGVIDGILLDILKMSTELLYATCARSTKSSRRRPLSKQSLFHSLLTYLLQCNGFIREVCGDAACRRKLLNTSTFLCISMELSLTEHALPVMEDMDALGEILLSVARISSRLSLHEGFRTQVNGRREVLKYYSKAMSLLSVTQAENTEQSQNNAESHPASTFLPTVSRLAFTLGNMTTSNADNRYILGIEFKVMEPLISILQRLSKQFVQEFLNLVDKRSCEEEDEERVAQAEEERVEAQLLESAGTLVSLLRLFANLCIEPTVGQRIRARQDVMEVLADLLSCSHAIAFEDLILNTIAAITNLTYYTCGCDGSSTIHSLDASFLPAALVNTLQHIAEHLLQHIDHDNNEIVLETAKALGNLSRSSWVLDDMIASDAYTRLLEVCYTTDIAIQASALGIFINASGHASSRKFFLGPKQDIELVKNLSILLKKTAIKNISGSTQICKVLYNMFSQVKLDFDIALGALIADSLLQGLKATLFELIDCVEELRAEVEDAKETEGAALRSYDQFYLTATSLYDLLESDAGGMNS